MVHKHSATMRLLNRILKSEVVKPGVVSTLADDSTTQKNPGTSKVYFFAKQTRLGVEFINNTSNNAKSLLPWRLRLEAAHALHGVSVPKPHASGCLSCVPASLGRHHSKQISAVLEARSCKA